MSGKTEQERKCDMDYAEWEKHKDELRNESMKPLCMVSYAAREVMRAALNDGAVIEVLDSNGVFGRKYCEGLHSGHIYRISPDWQGPAKPETKTEYMDVAPYVEGAMHVLSHPMGYKYLLSGAQNYVAFAGYVYETDGKEMIRPRLLFDSLPDGTFRLRVPKAVRFVKGAV
jgi:hypothetical protein